MQLADQPIVHFFTFLVFCFPPKEVVNHRFMLEKLQIIEVILPKAILQFRKQISFHVLSKVTSSHLLIHFGLAFIIIVVGSRSYIISFLNFEKSICLVERMRLFFGGGKKDRSVILWRFAPLEPLIMRLHLDRLTQIFHYTLVELFSFGGNIIFRFGSKLRKRAVKNTFWVIFCEKALSL